MIVKGEANQIAAMFAAMAKAQAAFAPALKDTQGHGYKYADLSAVIEATRSALTDNGLAIIQNPTTDWRVGEDGENHTLVFVETCIVHADGAHIEMQPISIVPTKLLRDIGHVPAYDAQAIGIAITYARRYAYMAVAGVAPEDTDGVNPAGAPSSMRNVKEVKGATRPKAPPKKTQATKSQPAPPLLYGDNPESDEMREAAIGWALNQGAFSAKPHATNSFKVLAKEHPNATIEEVKILWFDKVKEKQAETA